MDYTSRYNLTYNPFIKSAKDPLVETSQYSEICTRLDYLLQVKGFGLITGNPGMGKTTAVRNWIKNLNQTANKPIYAPLSTLTVMEFFRYLAIELGYEAHYKKSDNFRLIQEGVDRYVIEKKMTPIFIIDESNYLKNATLNDLKILFNFNMDSMNKAVILLVGLPVLNDILGKNIHEPLSQRIVMNYNIDPLTMDEGRKYVKEKFAEGGCKVDVFTKSAMEALLSGAGGVPRLIDKYVNASLLIGNQLNENIISAETVMKAIDDTRLI